MRKKKRFVSFWHNGTHRNRMGSFYCLSLYLFIGTEHWNMYCFQVITQHRKQNTVWCEIFAILSTRIDNNNHTTTKKIMKKKTNIGARGLLFVVTYFLYTSRLLTTARTMRHILFCTTTICMIPFSFASYSSALYRWLFFVKLSLLLFSDSGFCAKFWISHSQ